MPRALTCQTADATGPWPAAGRNSVRSRGALVGAAPEAIRTALQVTDSMGTSPLSSCALKRFIVNQSGGRTVKTHQFAVRFDR